MKEGDILRNKKSVLDKIKLEKPTFPESTIKSKIKPTSKNKLENKSNVKKTKIKTIKKVAKIKKKAVKKIKLKKKAVKLKIVKKIKIQKKGSAKKSVTKSKNAKKYKKLLHPKTAVDEKTAKAYETGIDKLLKIIKNNKQVRLRDAVKSLKAKAAVIEEWANILESHQLIFIEYHAFGTTVFKKK